MTALTAINETVVELHTAIASLLLVSWTTYMYMYGLETHVGDLRRQQKS